MRILYILLCCLCSVFSFSQNTEGEIIYEEKINIHKNLPPEAEAMKERIPEFRTTEKVLYFNKEEAYYARVPKEKRKKKDGEFRDRRNGRRGRGMRMMGGRGGKGKLYTDISNGNTLSATELMGKKFLVSGTSQEYSWKMTGESKQVGSYLCQKAIHKDSTSTIVAWFSPMIPVSIGPDQYSGLPGVILHIDINDGDRTITAQEVNLKVLEKNVIIRPTEGEAIRQEEFESLREEKMEEMRKEFGDNPRMMRGERRG